jgi:hypothetical protein
MIITVVSKDTNLRSEYDTFAELDTRSSGANEPHAREESPPRAPDPDTTQTVAFGLARTDQENTPMVRVSG